MLPAMVRPSAAADSPRPSPSAPAPLLQDDVLVDDLKNTVVVHYTVTAAHLLPQADGSTEATGHVSVVSGMDKMQFTG